MVVVGNVAHPAVASREYRFARPVNVTADGEGWLWLIVGTDSGFEGLSAFFRQAGAPCRQTDLTLRGTRARHQDAGAARPPT